MGLYSFMVENQSTYGSIVTSEAAKKRYVVESLAYNVKNKKFCELFPDLVELHESRKAKLELLMNSSSNSNEHNISKKTQDLDCASETAGISWLGILSIFTILGVTVLAIASAI